MDKKILATKKNKKSIESVTNLQMSILKEIVILILNYPTKHYIDKPVSDQGRRM